MQRTLESHLDLQPSPQPHSECVRIGTWLLA